MVIEYALIENKTIALIHIKDKAVTPVIIKNPEKNNAEEFYIRRNASTVALTMHEMLNYSIKKIGHKINNGQFKLNRLVIKKNPIFSNIDINFRDEKDKSNSPYVSLIIGPNGTGKSNLLRVIIDLFRQIYDHQKGKYQTHIYGEYHLEYSIGKNNFVYSNTNVGDNPILMIEAKLKKNKFITKNDTILKSV